MPELTLDTDTYVFQALRTFRTSFFSYVRQRIENVDGGGDAAVQRLFSKEWDSIVAASEQAVQAGIVRREPVDSLDLLSVNHVTNLVDHLGLPRESVTTDLACLGGRPERMSTCPSHIPVSSATTSFA